MQTGPKIRIGTPAAAAALSAWHRRWEDPDDDEDEYEDDHGNLSLADVIEDYCD